MAREVQFKVALQTSHKYTGSYGRWDQNQVAIVKNTLQYRDTNNYAVINVKWVVKP